MSARSAIARLPAPRLSVPTTPVPPTPSATSSRPNSRSLAATNALVRFSSNPNSGWACRSRLQAVISRARAFRSTAMRVSLLSGKAGDDVEQDVGAGDEIAIRRVLARIVADAADARHEDHGSRRDPGDHLGIVARA